MRRRLTVLLLATLGALGALAPGTLTIIGRNVTRNCVNRHFSDHTLGLTYFVH
jgi:hypothetical protein